MQAIANGRPEPALQSGPATASLYEQARSLRKRAAWSDLRKGVIIGAIGFAMTAYSDARRRVAECLGLVLLFVGIGFVVLWYLEDGQGRSARERRRAGPEARNGSRPRSVRPTVPGARWRRPRIRMPAHRSRGRLRRPSRVRGARSADTSRGSGVPAQAHRGSHALATTCAGDLRAWTWRHSKLIGRKRSSRRGCTASRPTAGSPTARKRKEELLGDAADTLADTAGTAFATDAAVPITHGARR